MRLKKLIATLLAILFFGGTIVIVSIDKQEPNYMTFDDTLIEVNNFYKSVVGVYPDTPIKDFDLDVFGQTSGNVLAYCYLQPGNKYIAYNYKAIEDMVKETGNLDLTFQVIIHELTHCQAHMGHVEIYNHFMNNGGAPGLTKSEVKQQFKSFVKYYNNFANRYYREPEDLNNVYALMIEKDSEGNIKTTCTCSMCTGVK